jgi:hypothetical protein
LQCQYTGTCSRVTRIYLHFYAGEIVKLQIRLPSYMDLQFFIPKSQFDNAVVLLTTCFNCFMTPSIFSLHKAISRWRYDKWMMNWKAFVAKSSYYPGTCLERLKKYTKTLVRTASVPTEIRIEQFLNTHPENCHYDKPLGVFLLNTSFIFCLS